MQVLILWLLLIAPIGSYAQTVAEPDGFRLDSYRAAVPETIAGGTTINVQDAFLFWQDGKTVFVDVLPQAPKPANLPAGTIWRDKPRNSIPGAIWLPNTGYGELAEITQVYFQDNLALATEGDLAKPIVLFCLADCWMSWNAAKRAINAGYTSVYWFPEGTDAWDAAGHPLARIWPQEPQP